MNEYEAGYIHRPRSTGASRPMPDPYRTVADVQRDKAWLEYVTEQQSTETRVTDPETGGMKGQKAEQYSLIPTEALAPIARVYAYGAQKYDRNNWRLGYAWHLSYDAMQRHLNAFWGGEDLDPESGLPHLAHAVFHCMTLLTYMQDQKYKTKDDRA